MNQDLKLGRDHFLARLAAEFPEVVAKIGKYDVGLLQCEVAVFRTATEAALDAGAWWLAERHFRLVDELLARADPDLRNALEVSYLEDLALGECTETRHRAINERMPASLRMILIRHNKQWQ